MQRIGIFVFCAFVLGTTLFGQTLGEIAGEVKDSTGAVVPNGSVTVVNTGTNASRTTTTNEAGIYTVPSLVPGTYSVRIEAGGFRPMVNTKVEVQVQQTVRVDFALEVGSVNEAVNVSATAGLLATENATVGTVIENRRIVDLPLNGRNFLQLVSLSPNVTYGFATPGQAAGRQGGSRSHDQNISLMGMRGTWNRYTLDGVENTDVNFNLYVVLPSIDALQEFKVQSGIYPAEFGRAASADQRLHQAGSQSVPRRDCSSSFAMTSWMRSSTTSSGPVRQRAPSSTTSTGSPSAVRWCIPKLFNGKDKLFFMSNCEGFRQRTLGYGLYTTPTAAMRDGDFSYALPGNQLYDPASKAFVNGVLTGTPFPNNQIPKTRFDPTSVKLLEFWPVAQRGHHRAQQQLPGGPRRASPTRTS